MLVSRKVEYEDVWDLRNVGDLLESGSKGGTLAKGLIGHDLVLCQDLVQVKMRNFSPF